jgi:K+-dependent Na+/Ca+ exchanger-like protein
VGTIVGSALFNLLVIVGVACIAAPLFIRWKSVIRDLIFYLGSVGILLFSFKDGIIALSETIIFVGIYIVYLFVLGNWKKIDPLLDNVYTPTEDIPEKVKHRFHMVVEKLLSWTFPNMGKNPHLYPVTFVLSILYIGILSSILVELAVMLAEQLSVPNEIIALTILAAGTSIPDLLSSISASRRGFGTMAVSNAIGSNTFNILIGLGLPWMVYNLLTHSSLSVEAESINNSTWFLFGGVALFLVWLFLQKFVLKKGSGILLLLIYGTYLGYILFTFL